MATETLARLSSRPRPWLLVLLGLAVVALVASRMFSDGAPVPSVPTTAGRAPQPQAQPVGRVDPAELDVRLDALKQPSLSPGGSDRNPFRFRPPPPPPPPPPPKVGPKPEPVPEGPPPPPPIPIKFIGIVETAGGKVGAFTDCRATFPGREGEVIEGRYRVVRLGIESAVVEYTDGRGRTTLPLNGQAQACMGK